MTDGHGEGIWSRERPERGEGLKEWGLRDRDYREEGLRSKD